MENDILVIFEVDRLLLLTTVVVINIFAHDDVTSHFLNPPSFPRHITSQMSNP